MLNVGTTSGARTLVIVFSGMGEDGGRQPSAESLMGHQSAARAAKRVPTAQWLMRSPPPLCGLSWNTRGDGRKLLKSMENETLIQRRNLHKGQ